MLGNRKTLGMDAARVHSKLRKHLYVPSFEVHAGSLFSMYLCACSAVIMAVPAEIPPDDLRGQPTRYRPAVGSLAVACHTYARDE
jgi:hypothetical protein